eukprot:scaffold4306_cov114-Isochrysis_galbana.AAC.8
MVRSCQSPDVGSGVSEQPTGEQTVSVHGSSVYSTPGSSSTSKQTCRDLAKRDSPSSSSSFRCRLRRAPSPALSRYTPMACGYESSSRLPSSSASGCASAMSALVLAGTVSLYCGLDRQRVPGQVETQPPAVVATHSPAGDEVVESHPEGAVLGPAAERRGRAGHILPLHRAVAPRTLPLDQRRHAAVGARPAVAVAESDHQCTLGVLHLCHRVDEWTVLAIGQSRLLSGSGVLGLEGGPE